MPGEVHARGPVGQQHREAREPFDDRGLRVELQSLETSRDGVSRGLEFCCWRGVLGVDGFRSPWNMPVRSPWNVRGRVEQFPRYAGGLVFLGGGTRGQCFLVLVRALGHHHHLAVPSLANAHRRHPVDLLDGHVENPAVAPVHGI